ncbi:hypothetical protein MRB53_040004 [Persea americana]|nr:hypothetical protein MRB53_040004 [Persea americana]
MEGVDKQMQDDVESARDSWCVVVVKWSAPRASLQCGDSRGSAAALVRVTCLLPERSSGGYNSDVRWIGSANRTIMFGIRLSAEKSPVKASYETKSMAVLSLHRAVYRCSEWSDNG